MATHTKLALGEAAWQVADGRADGKLTSRPTQRARTGHGFWDAVRRRHDVQADEVDLGLTP